MTVQDCDRLQEAVATIQRVLAVAVIDHASTMGSTA